MGTPSLSTRASSLQSVAIGFTRRYWKVSSRQRPELRTYRLNWARLHARYGLTKRLHTNIQRFFVWYIIRIERRNGVVAPNTIHAAFRVFWHLYALASERRISAISQLDADFQQAFVFGRLGSRKGKRPVARKSAATRFLVLRELCVYCHDHLRSFRLNHALVRQFRRLKDGGFKPVDEATAVALVRDAIVWIKSHGPRLVGSLEDLWDERTSWVGLTRYRRQRLDYQIMDKLLPDGERATLARALGLEGATPARLLHTARRETLAACAIVILFLTGMRISELYSLRTGCIEAHKHSDGRSYTYVRGTLAKARQRTHRWICPNEVVLAIQLLEKLASLNTDAGSRGMLFAHFHQKLLPPKGLIARATGRSGVNRLLNQYAHDLRRSRSLPDTDRLHAHRARKTFARFVALRDKRGLEGLAVHYGHIRSAITDKYYVGSDLKLDEMMRDCDRDDLANALTDILTAKRLAGKAGEFVLKSRSSLLRFRGASVVKAKVDSLIAAGVRLAPCNWGYCLYRQELSMCNGTSTSPSPAHRSPGVCSSCSNFCVTSRHKVFWQTRERADAEFLQRENLPELTQLFVEQRLKESRQIVASIQDEEILHEDE